MLASESISHMQENANLSSFPRSEHRLELRSSIRRCFIQLEISKQKMRIFVKIWRVRTLTRNHVDPLVHEVHRRPSGRCFLVQCSSGTNKVRNVSDVDTDFQVTVRQLPAVESIVDVGTSGRIDRTHVYVP